MTALAVIPTAFFVCFVSSCFTNTKQVINYKHKHTTKTNTKEPTLEQLFQLLSLCVLSELVCKHEPGGNRLKHTINTNTSQRQPLNWPVIICMFSLCILFLVLQTATAKNKQKTTTNTSWPGSVIPL